MLSRQRGILQARCHHRTSSQRAGKIEHSGDAAEAVTLRPAAGVAGLAISWRIIPCEFQEKRPAHARLDTGMAEIGSFCLEAGRRPVRTSPMSIDHDRFAPLRTSRLRLRCIEPGDAAVVSRLMTPSVSRWVISWPVPFTVEMAAERIDRARDAARADTMLPFAIERLSDQAFLGWLSVTRTTDRRALLSYWLGEQHHGHGYMREAVAVAVAAAFRLLDIPAARHRRHRGRRAARECAIPGGAGRMRNGIGRRADDLRPGTRAGRTMRRPRTAQATVMKQPGDRTAARPSRRTRPRALRPWQGRSAMVRVDRDHVSTMSDVMATDPKPHPGLCRQRHHQDDCKIDGKELDQHSHRHQKPDALQHPDHGFPDFAELMLVEAVQLSGRPLQDRHPSVPSDRHGGKCAVR